MNLEQIELAHRTVACKHWRWIAGMKAVKYEEHSTSWFRIEETHPRLTGVWASALPDLSDAATLGCLLALVREAWADECACVLPIDYGPAGVMWVARLTAGGRSLTERHWPTEAAALIAALEAAP